MERHRFLAALLTLLVGIGCVSDAVAQTKVVFVQKGGVHSKDNAGQKPKSYYSANFLVHTDMPEKDAKELLVKLENMLKIISGYWGVRNRKTIKCFVIHRLANWTPGSLDSLGYKHVAGGGGVTITQAAFRGNRLAAAKAVVYAPSVRNVAQHEAVHAYCAQNFGRTGPVWYSEGMAEMGQYWKKAPKKGEPLEVHCEPYVLRYIQNSEPKSLADIVDRNEKTGDSWKAYSWRWALCHLLATNPNYSPRFRTLGLALLNKRRATFKSTYGAMSKEISFEYKFFLQHLDKGYRVDLCSWNWKAKFKKPFEKRIIKSTISAHRGWQPSRVMVEKGKTYQFTTEGTWKTEKKGADISAVGVEDGNGKLMGVIFDQFELGKPFELGKEGTFTATQDGKLFLRCKDKWNKLADNTGKMKVHIKSN